MDGEISTFELKTVSDRNEAIGQIDILINSMEHIDIDVLTALGKKIHDHVSDKRDSKERLIKLKKTLLENPVVEITLAFSPSSRDELEIVSMVRSQINENAFVELKTNKYLIGGAQITYLGKYYDGSLVKKISQNV